MSVTRKNTVTLLLSLVGIVLSSISIFHYAGIKYGFQTQPSFCNISATINCDAVNASRYAEIAGVPVSSLALFFYLALFLFSFSLTRKQWISDQKLNSLYLTLSIGAVLFSAYLGFVSYTLIHALCITCMGLYAVNFLLLINSLSGTSPSLFLADCWNGTKSWIALFACSHTYQIKILVYTAILFGLSVYTPPFLGSLYHKNPNTEALIAAYEKNPSFAFPINTDGLNQDSYKGNLKSKVTVIEFADFECPACRMFSKSFDEVAEEFKDRVLFVHKQFPLDNDCNQSIPQKFHQHACHAAFFARCAGEQDKYWQAYSFLFSLPELDKEKKSAEVSKAIDDGARQLGLDETAMNECMTSRRHLGKIQADIREGIDAGLQGTPTIFVNGRVLTETSKEALRTIILHELKK